jgi:hypothetical protein
MRQPAASDQAARVSAICALAPVRGAANPTGANLDRANRRTSSEDVTFRRESTAGGLVMDAVMDVGDWSESVEALYRHDSDRLWRALCALGGDRDISSEAIAELPGARPPRAWYTYSAP